MKKKIILISFCLILFLIFTALSYAKPDPRYIFQGDPWDRMLSPKPNNDQNLPFVVILIKPHFYLMFKCQYKAENFNDLDKLTDQKSSSSIKQSSLNKNEARFNK